MTNQPLFWVAILACLAVLAVLVVGIGGFAKGGEFNRKYANKLMQLRLLLQFIAVILIIIFAYFFRSAG